MTQPTFVINKEQLDELTELLEDTISHFCDTNYISGETAWTVSECLAISKIAQLKGEVV